MNSLPDAANAQGDTPHHTISLLLAIESTLSTARHHADQMERVRELKDQADVIEKAEQETGSVLFKINPTSSPEFLKAPGDRGDYIRAKFRLLLHPVCTPHAQIIAPAGIGKTRECAQQLRIFAGLTVYYMVPTHSLAKQLVATLELSGLRNVHQVRGRTAPGMCELPDIAEQSSAIASAGLSVQAKLCGDPDSQGGGPDSEDDNLCPHFHDCKYQAQRLAYAVLKISPDEPLIFVMPHQYLVSLPTFLPPADLKIIDESCWQIFVKKSKLALTDLHNITKSAPTQVRRNLEKIAASLGAGTSLLKALRDAGLKEPADFEAVSSWLTGEIKELTGELVKSPELDFQKLGPWLATHHLVSQLSSEIQLDRLPSHSISFPDCESPNTKHQIGIYSLHSTQRNVPVILLDASADTKINSRIWSPIKEFSVGAVRNATIYQVRGKAFSSQSILGVGVFDRPINPEEAEDLRQQIIQFITNIQDHYSKLLVVAQKGVTQELEGPLQHYIGAGRILMGHFSALRGLNSFEDCDAAVIVGREQPSPGGVEAYARAFYWNDPQPLLLGQDFKSLPATRQMADGSNEKEYIQRHQDPRIDRFLRQIREREIEQAIDRLRLIHNIEPKTIYLLTSIPIEGSITASAKWARFRKAGQNRIGQAILKSIEQVGNITVGGEEFEAVVLPFSRELWRCFPEIWPSSDTARDAWRDGGKFNGGRLQIIFIFGNAPHLIVKFRRPGQRGKSCHALVAIRRLGAVNRPLNHTDDTDPTGSANCASTGQKSPPPTIAIDPYANFTDVLRAAAAAALQRITGPVKIISVETNEGA